MSALCPPEETKDSLIEGGFGRWFSRIPLPEFRTK